jgi:hypothetical protein
MVSRNQASMTPQHGSQLNRGPHKRRITTQFPISKRNTHSTLLHSPKIRRIYGKKQKFILEKSILIAFHGASKTRQTIVSRKAREKEIVSCGCAIRDVCCIYIEEEVKNFLAIR